MNKFTCTGLAIAASLVMAGMASTAQAKDSVNVAFFLEWATPNQIAKVDKAYDDAMGVDVNWTDFSTGVQMTEAMLAGDIDIAYSQCLAPFVTAIQQGAPLKMVGIAVVYEANDCFVRNDLGITSANASELEGKTVAVPLGIYMGVSRFFKSFFDPLIELYRPVPPLAWAPLILTIFGIQDDGKIFLLFMVAFAIMVISARTGASGTQLSKIRASHSLGATNNQILRHVILPNALPEILTGVRIAIGVCWGTLVAAEMLAGTTGIGFIENVARTVSDYELIWVTILIMGLLGLLFDLVMRWAIARLIPWRGKG